MIGFVGLAIVIAIVIGDFAYDIHKINARSRRILVSSEQATREVPGDYLAECIEARWLEACETDAVQVALRTMDEHDAALAAAQAARVLQPRATPKRCCYTTLPHKHMLDGSVILTVLSAKRYVDAQGNVTLIDANFGAPPDVMKDMLFGYGGHFVEIVKEGKA